MFKVSTSTLRRVLWIDAASGLAMGLSHLLASGPLEAWTGVPVGWLQIAAMVVLAAAGMASWLGTRSLPPSAGVRLLAAGNLVWVVASVWLLVGSGLSLTALGQAWVMAQALVVLILAELEWFGAAQPAALRMA